VRYVGIKITSPDRDRQIQSVVQIHNEAQESVTVTREVLRMVKDWHVNVGDHINIYVVQPDE
jgi:hypothetical protein